MNEIDSHWDVIGSGLGGLSAAARLAHSGLRVLVLEQHEYSGGYAHHFLRKVRGTKIVYEFDVALHQTGDLAPGRQMGKFLDELGVLQHVRLNRFDIAYRTRGPAHDLQIPADADAYESLLCDSYPETAGGVRDLFQTLREIDAPAADGGMSDAALASMDLSLQDFMDQHVRDERIQGVFATLWGYLGLLPSEASAFLYARLWASYHFGGCFYVQGGGQALANAFVSEIESHGGRVLLRTAVTGIQTTGGRVSSVETRKRGTFHAPVVVSNASAPQTFHTLLDDPKLADADLERVDSLPVACSIHQAYVGIRGDASKVGLADRGAFFNDSYDFALEAEGLRTGDYTKQGWLTGNHNLADPGHHPPGRSILHASVMALGETGSTSTKRNIKRRRATWRTTWWTNSLWPFPTFGTASRSVRSARPTPCSATRGIPVARSAHVAQHPPAPTPERPYRASISPEPGRSPARDSQAR
jgi:all-trans-retinol 13,14-reductase